MANWYEGKRDENERWKLYYVVCSRCGYRSSQLLETCPKCGSTIEGFPPYLNNGNGCLIDEALLSFQVGRNRGGDKT